MPQGLKRCVYACVCKYMSVYAGVVRQSRVVDEMFKRKQIDDDSE